MLRSLGFKLIFLWKFHTWTFSIFSDFIISQKGELWFTICEFVTSSMFILFWKIFSLMFKYSRKIQNNFFTIHYTIGSFWSNAKNLRRNWIFCFCFFLFEIDWKSLKYRLIWTNNEKILGMYYLCGGFWWIKYHVKLGFQVSHSNWSTIPILQFLKELAISSSNRKYCWC